MSKIVKYLVLCASAMSTISPITVHAMGEDGAASTAGGAAAVLLILFMILSLLFWGFFIFLWVFWILMVIDIARRDFKKDGDKAAYFVLVILLNLVGALIYYFAVKRHLDKK